jgi:outer membrane protein assembly factor BamA
VFFDAGRMWARDVPFGVDSGWKASVGFGLRLASPAGSDRTTRIEFTLPFDRSVEADPTYFRFYVDLGGVLRSLKNEQVDRSRFSGVSSDMVNRPRRGS